MIIEILQSANFCEPTLQRDCRSLIVNTNKVKDVTVHEVVNIVR